MNKKLESFIDECYVGCPPVFDAHKFAELIIQDCINLCDLEKNLEFYPDEYQKGFNSGIDECITILKKLTKEKQND